MGMPQTHINKIQKDSKRIFLLIKILICVKTFLEFINYNFSVFQYQIFVTGTHLLKYF